MLEGNPPRVQKLAVRAERVEVGANELLAHGLQVRFARADVKLVADDRVAEMREVRADLMQAAGLRLAAHERELPVRRQAREPRDRGLTGADGLTDADLAALG